MENAFGLYLFVLAWVKQLMDYEFSTVFIMSDLTIKVTTSNSPLTSYNFTALGNSDSAAATASGLDKELTDSLQTLGPVP